MDVRRFQQLRSIVRRYVDMGGGSVDIKRWLAASELSGHRLALLLGGDLPTVAQQVVQSNARTPGRVSTKQVVRDLILYSLSDDFQKARRAFGLRMG